MIVEDIVFEQSISQQSIIKEHTVHALVHANQPEMDRPIDRKTDPKQMPDQSKREAWKFFSQFSVDFIGEKKKMNYLFPDYRSSFNYFLL